MFILLLSVCLTVSRMPRRPHGARDKPGLSQGGTLTTAVCQRTEQILFDSVLLWGHPGKCGGGGYCFCLCTHSLLPGVESGPDKGLDLSSLSSNGQTQRAVRNHRRRGPRSCVPIAFIFPVCQMPGVGWGGLEPPASVLLLHFHPPIASQK